MGVPILSEIWDGIRWVIDFFVNKAPKPITFLFFLLMLLAFGVVINFSLHIMGVHCNSAGDPVKTSMMDFPTNIQVLWEANSGDLSENATQTEVHPQFWSDRGFGLCSDFLKLTAEGCYDTCDNLSDTSCRWYYRTPGCFNCTELNIMLCGVDTQLLGDSRQISVCASDVRETDVSAVRWFFTCPRHCSIPDGYYYDWETSNYICEDLAVCGTNATNKNTRLDELLSDADAELMYKNDNKDAFSMIKFKCDKQNLNPALTFFSIPVFDYRVWIFIGVINIMFMFLAWITKH